ncbi:MAG: TatD family hydrolase [Kiritimatiellae bacterium]|nr:TatD family hydrolase [Kiritimatiellia bacterium]
MTDVHCHVSRPGNVRQFVTGEDFVGIHPWETLEMGSVPNDVLAEISERLAAQEKLGVGEIGLDRLKNRDIPPVMRETFIAQLELAARFRRPVVLHGAKCWGQVAAACKPFAGRIPAFLFHGFSRSDGLLGDIAAVNGFVSVGPAVLNDHAVNYRRLVVKIPAERLLVETDCTAENEAECPSIADVARKLAELRGMTYEELEALTDMNARRFRGEC